MTVETPFSSSEEARETYYGGDPPDPDDTEDPGAGWHDPEEEDVLAGGWVLLSQNQRDGDRTRWFVVGGPEGGYLNESGGTVFPDENETMNDMPSFSTEQEAREAHALWVEENPEEVEDDEGSPEWTDWTEMDEVPPWFLYTREHVEEDRAQFLVAGKNGDGETVYLAPGGEVQSDPHIYEDPDALGDALDAYFEAVENGEIPEEDQPTGEKPDRSGIQQDTDEAESGSGAGALVGAAVEAATSNPLLAVGVAAGGYYAYSQYGGEGA